MKTKKYLLLFFLSALLCFGASAQGESKINWMSWDEAVEANKTAPKKMFIDLYTWWCGWCKRMDATTFKDKGIVEAMNKNFYAVKMNAEMKDTIVFNNFTFTNPNPNGKRSPHQLAASLLNNKLSYPSFVIMNEEVQRLQIIPGYQQPAQLQQYLDYYADDQHMKKEEEGKTQNN